MLINLVLLFFLVFSLLLMGTAIVNIWSGAPFVPSKRKTISRMIKLAQLKKGMTVYDLGCGDGRLLVRAKKQADVRAIGYENAPIAYLLAWLNKTIHRCEVDLRFKNFFKASLSDADVIFTYLTPEVQKKLSAKILKECKPGTRIVSNTFKLPEFKPSKVVEKNKSSGNNTLYLYKVPRP